MVWTPFFADPNRVEWRGWHPRWCPMMSGDERLAGRGSVGGGQQCPQRTVGWFVASYDHGLDWVRLILPWHAARVGEDVVKTCQQGVFELRALPPARASMVLQEPPDPESLPASSDRTPLHLLDELD